MPSAWEAASESWTPTYTVPFPPVTLGCAMKGYWVPAVMAGSDFATTMVDGRLAVAGYHTSCRSPVVVSVCTA